MKEFCKSVEESEIVSVELEVILIESITTSNIIPNTSERVLRNYIKWIWKIQTASEGLKSVWLG